MHNRLKFVAAVVVALTSSSAGWAAPDGAALEEIIVTAQRRSENAQRVPLAVTALSSADLELRTIENVEDLNVLLPNVDIRGSTLSAGASGNFAIRGIPGVARYFDGVLHSGVEGALEDIVELERVEVLRGPQGTLFGKNAIGGAMQFIAQKPQHELGARLKLTLGDYSRADVVANVDIPLSRSVAAKVTLADMSRDGYVTSVTTGERYGEHHYELFRGMLEWDNDQSFSALFTLERSVQDENMQANVLWNVFEQMPTPIDYNAAGIPFTDSLYAYGQRHQYLNAADHRGPGNDVETDAFTATLEWNFGQSLLLRSISGVRDVEWGSWQDYDATQLVQYERWNYSLIDETSQELQLLGGREPLHWIVGLYYFQDDRLNKQLNWQRYEVIPQLLFQDLGRNVKTDTAVFGEVAFGIGPRLVLTVGGRYSGERFEFTTFDPAEPMPPPHTASRNMDGTVRVVNGVPLEGGVAFDAFSPRVAVQYQFNDDVMLFLNAAEGFDGGGINTRFDPTLPNNGILPYGSTTLTNVEIGLRADLANRRLRVNATGFGGIWKDIQVDEVLTPGTLTTTNAGRARIDGVEVEGRLSATDALLVDLTLGLLDARYTDVGRATTISVGTPFPFAPKKSYSLGVQHRASLREGGAVTTRLDYGWIDDFETIRDSRFQVSAFNKGYGLLSARVGYEPPAAKWSLAVSGTNLTNEYYRLGGVAAFLAGIDEGVVARPREVAVSVSLRL
jgi:iron complex outermembrane receptor protein